MAFSPKPTTSLNLLSAISAFSSGLPRTNDTVFFPFIQCSTLLPSTTSRSSFHSPIGLTTLSLAAGIRSYSDPMVRLPSLPFLASGCRSSSSTWNSKLTAFFWLPSVLSSVTRYFTPLLPLAVSFTSSFSSKLSNCSVVMMSPAR